MVQTVLIFMAGPYDYSINIPQPPAQNFLQSLLGIQQLKGLQQQSQLAEQQAAIQQQNAAFQQQMQPLEMEKARAAIAAQQSALAGSEQSRRQNEILFRQGQENRVREMEQQAVAQAKQNELFGKLTSFSADTPMSDILPVVNELALFKPESAKQILQGFEMAPKQIQKATETTLVSAANQLKAGDIEGARNTYSTFAAAIQNSMGKNPEVKAIADAANVQAKLLDPQTGQAGINIAKASALELLGVFNPQALTSIVGAEKSQAETKTELAKLTPGGKEMSEKQLADINALTDEAANARITVGGLTNAVDSLLKFAEQKPKEFKTGMEARGQQFKSFIFGDTTEAQNLRATIQPFATKEWIAKASGLKGSLSEKEGARLDKGAPDVMTAGAGELLNWMRLVQKVELLDADRKELSAAWQANARSLQSKAPTAFEVANVSVKPGDSYQQTLAKIVAGYKKKSEADIQADAVRLKRIQDAEKSGQSPVPNMFNLGGAPQQQQQPATLRPKLISIE
jgi:hypothetical protein